MFLRKSPLVFYKFTRTAESMMDPAVLFYIFKNLRNPKRGGI